MKQQENKPRLSVIIVTYNAMDEAKACLLSIKESGVPVTIHVVDNNSGTAMQQMLRELQTNWNSLKLHLLTDNIGLAAGNNIPISEIDTQYTLILNPDTILNEQVLTGLIQFMDEHPNAAAAGPRQVYEDGNPHSSFHSGWHLGHITLWSLLPRSVLSHWYDKRESRFKTKKTGYVSGSCMIIRSDVYRELNGYDPAYFLSVEDVADLCRRARDLKYDVFFVNELEIVHLGARSSVKFFSYTKNCQGRLHYAKKWYGTPGYVYTLLVLYFNSAIKLLFNFLNFGQSEKRKDAITMHIRLIKTLARLESESTNRHTKDA